MSARLPTRRSCALGLVCAVVAWSQSADGRADQGAPPPVVTGVLLSASDGAPLTGATVGLCEHLDADAGRGRLAAGRYAPEPIRTIRTDAEGRFAMPVSGSAPLYLIARAGGHAASIISRPFAAGARDLGGIRLPAGRRLQGRVLDPEGSPIAGVRVVGVGTEFDHGSIFKPLPLLAETVSDPNGLFALEDLGLPGVRIAALAAGIALRPQQVDTGSDGKVTVRLQRSVKLSGRVLAPDGESPAPGAWVTARDGGHDLISRAGTDGRFELDRVSPSEVTLSARTPLSARDAAAFHAPSEEVKVRAGGGSSPPTLRLLPGARVKARVLDGKTLAPIPSARVNLSSHGDPVITDAAGEASLVGVSPGRLYVRAWAEGFREASILDFLVQQGEDRRLGIRLDRTASLQGRVVASATKEPVPGAVLLAGTLWTGGLMQGVRDQIELEESRTGADGTFRLQGLPSGERILVEARLPDHAASRIEVEPLGPGEHRAGVEVLLEAGHEIVGRVVDPEGQPVPGARVVAVDAVGGELAERLSLALESTSLTLRGRAGEPALDEVTTRADGRFSATGARAGRWSVIVKATGFATSIVRGILVEAPSGGDAGDLALQRGVRIRGRVVGAEGEPVHDARVYVRDSEDLPLLHDVEEREDGTFESVDLPPGSTYTVSASADGYLDFDQHDVAPPVDDLVMILAKGVSIAGLVLDARTGRPVTEYTVSVRYPRPGGGRQVSESGKSDSVRSGTGRFELAGVRPGRLRLEVTAAGYRRGVSDDLEVRSEGPPEEILVRLEPSVVVSGLVVDEEGRPLAGVQVAREPLQESGLSFEQMLRMDMDSPTTETDMEGEFRLELSDAEPLRLVFQREGFQPAELALDPGLRREGLRLTMQRGAVLRGVVVKAHDGTPLQGANVRAERSGAGFLSSTGSTVTGQDGSFQIDGLRPGLYDVSAGATGFQAAQVESILVSHGSATASITLILDPGTRLLGRITGLDPSDLRELTVSAGGSPAGGASSVDRDGRFQVDGLPEGRSVLSIRSSGSARISVWRVVDIPEGARTWETTIDLGGGFTVKGTVSRGGKGVAGVDVHFEEATLGHTAETRTGPGGEYVVLGLQPGDYKVSVTRLVDTLVHSAGDVVVEQDHRFDIILPVGSVSGTITAAGSGRPLPGASVSVQRAGGAPSLEEQAQDLFKGNTADDEGRFSIVGLSEGAYWITARAAGYGYESQEVALRGEAPEATVSFSLSPADPLPVRVVLSTSGEPAAGGVFVLAVVPGGGDPLAPQGAGDRPAYQGVAQTDGSGRLRVESLKPGRYDLVVWIPGLAAETIHDVAVPAAELTASLSPGTPILLHGDLVPEGPPGRAILLDARGRPVYLQAVLADPTFPVEKGMKGLMGVLEAGTYTLRARFPDGRSIERTFMVPAGGASEVVIR